MKHALLEPVALEQEIDFILNTAGKLPYQTPQRKECFICFAGLRPLAAPQARIKNKRFPEFIN